MDKTLKWALKLPNGDYRVCDTREIARSKKYLYPEATLLRVKLQVLS